MRREREIDLYDLPSKNFGDAENVIEVEKLKKEYKLKGKDNLVVAIKEINMNSSTEIYPIRRGEFVMLRGPSGCGKTTFLNILGTIDRASSGQVSKKK